MKAGNQNFTSVNQDFKLLTDRHKIKTSKLKTITTKILCNDHRLAMRWVIEHSSMQQWAIMFSIIVFARLI